jgi:hypothetical protein
LLRLFDLWSRVTDFKVKRNCHRFCGFYRLSRIKSVTSVRSVVKIYQVLLLTKEAMHSDSSIMRFSSAELTFLLPLNNKRKLPQILRILQIITNKIRNISEIRGKKTTTPLCLADKGSNSSDSSVMRFSSAELTFLLPLNNKRKLPPILRI